MLMKKAMKGELPLMAAAKALQDEILGPPAHATSADERPLAAERRAVAAFKKVRADGGRHRRCSATATSCSTSRKC